MAIELRMRQHSLVALDCHEIPLDEQGLEQGLSVLAKRVKLECARVVMCLHEQYLLEESLTLPRDQTPRNLESHLSLYVDSLSEVFSCPLNFCFSTGIHCEFIDSKTSDSTTVHPSHALPEFPAEVHARQAKATMPMLSCYLALCRKTFCDRLIIAFTQSGFNLESIETGHMAAARLCKFIPASSGLLFKSTHHCSLLFHTEDTLAQQNRRFSLLGHRNKPLFMLASSCHNTIQPAETVTIDATETSYLQEHQALKRLIHHYHQHYREGKKIETLYLVGNWREDQAGIEEISSITGCRIHEFSPHILKHHFPQQWPFEFNWTSCCYSLPFALALSGVSDVR